MSKLDGSLKEKKTEIDSISNEIKNENLTGLTIEYSCGGGILNPSVKSVTTSKLNGESDSMPTKSGEDGHITINNNTMYSTSTIPRNGFYNRIGSTRKLGRDARDLRHAVATNKNPNGVWV